MFDTAKKFAARSSYILNGTVLAFLAVAWLAVHTGHAKADVELVGWSVGGGTMQHAEREQQLAALQTALPVKALTPPPAVQSPPLPQKKPAVK
jgi:hypothetical protein